MTLHKSFPKSAVTLVITIAVISVFTLHSFAAPDLVEVPVTPSLAQDCAGTLTVKGGRVTINGNPAQTGATVMTSSLVATGSNAGAIVDLGLVGLVELGENTTVTLTCAAGTLDIRTSCERTKVEVRSGTLEVKSPKVETVTAGEKKYDSPFDATATRGINVKVECGNDKKGAFIGPGLGGLLAVIGIGAGVAIGIDVGSGDVPPTSPIR